MSELTYQEARLLRIVEGSSDGLWDWDLKTNEIFFNHQAYVLLDIPEKATPPTFDDFIGRILLEDQTPTRLAMQELIEHGTPYRMNHPILLPDGSIRTLLCKGKVTVWDTQGNPSKISGTISDITHLKQIERALKETQDRLDRVIAGSAEGYWEWEVEPDKLFWSDRIFQLLGLTKPDDPVTYSFFESLLPEEDKPRIRAAVDKTLQEGTPIHEELRMRHASGNYLYFYVRGKPYYDKQGKIIRISGMVSDITQQKQQELQLAESEKRFRTLAEASPVMIWMTNELAELIYCNKAYREFYHAEELSGLDWAKYLHPVDLEQLKEELPNLLENPKPRSSEFRVRQPDGSYRWMYTMRTPRWDENGKFLGYMGASIDITKRKNIEQELKEYARKLEKSNNELDQFVLVASHDLQEPLRKVALFSGFLKEAAGDQLPPECYDYIERLQKAIVRMQRLLDDLLVLSRITRKGKPPEPTDLGQVLKTVLAEVEKKRQAVHGTIEVGETMTIDVDEHQITQVFLNLVDNALKFHKPDVPPIVRINMKPVDEQTCEITVSDNGIGFDEKYLERVFQIFERLHGREEFEGSGVGLAIIQKIVQRHNGTVTAISKPGEGSTFIVRLPIHAEAPL